MFIFFFGLIYATHVFAAPGDWELVKKTSDEITVHRAEVPGSPLLKFKGEGEVPAPIWRVASVIFDTTRAPEWVVDLKDSKLVRWVSPTEFIEYDHVGTPPLISDRDFVSQVKMEVDPKEKTMKFRYKSVQDPTLPETSYVRGELMNTTFILKSSPDGSKTYIVGEIHADPKGSLPNWVVNMFQKDWPVDTLRNLRKQVAKENVKNDEKFFGWFNIPGAAPGATTAGATGP